MAVIYALLFFIGFILCTEAPKNADDDVEKEPPTKEKSNKMDSINLRFKVKMNASPCLLNTPEIIPGGWFGDREDCVSSSLS